MHTIEQHFTVSYSFPVIFTRDVFDAGNPSLRDVILRSGQRRARVLAVIDSEVARLTPYLLEDISRYGDRHSDVMKFVAPPSLIRGGELCKHEPVDVGMIHAMVDRHSLCRHSFILAIGGGAVLDAAGYAAATAHRGVRLIRLPTTVLSQNDAGVGVKNGVNAFGRKNFLGTFTPPFAVINDFDFLKTLQPRDLRSGIAEAVKVALIRDRSFFDGLYTQRKELASFQPDAMQWMIVRCAELHLQHIADSGDPFEFGSSRPLDFGHWIAHKLEELSRNELRHGEAVAIGIALDALYSSQMCDLSDLDLHRILGLLDDVGFSLYHPALSWLDVEKSLNEFREHLGGELSIPLLPGIGRRLDVNHIDTGVVRECIATLAQRPRKGEWQRQEAAQPEKSPHTEPPPDLRGPDLHTQ